MAMVVRFLRDFTCATRKVNPFPGEDEIGEIKIEQGSAALVRTVRIGVIESDDMSIEVCDLYRASNGKEAIMTDVPYEYFQILDAMLPSEA